jgi:hypothetical protein
MALVTDMVLLKSQSPVQETRHVYLLSFDAMDPVRSDMPPPRRSSLVPCILGAGLLQDLRLSPDGTTSPRSRPAVPCPSECSLLCSVPAVDYHWVLVHVVERCAP